MKKKITFIAVFIALFALSIYTVKAVNPANPTAAIHVTEQGETITLTVEGDYLVGTLLHLSAYVLTGTKTESPKTNDNIMTFVNILAISMAGLSISTYLIIKNKKSKKNN